MAVVIGDAAIRLRANSDGFTQEAEAGIAEPMGSVAKKAAGYFAAAFAAEKVGAFLKDSVTQYSDLNESVSKSGVVFGQYAKQVQQFTEGAATSMGLSRQQATESIATFGNLGVSLGLTQKQSADMSTKLVKLGGDLASFNNVDPAQAIEALRSGLVGQTEPLRQFGININQAALKQQALKMGLDATGPTLSAAVAAQASYALIMKESTTAQGDFQRTGAGLANQQRIIAAQFTDLKANVGGALYPFVQLGAHGISGILLPSLLKLTGGLADAGTAVQGDMTEIQNVTRAVFNGTAVSADDLESRVGIALGGLASSAVGSWGVFTDAARGGGLGVLATEPSFTGFLARFGSGLRGLQTQAVSTWGGIVNDAAPHLKLLEATAGPALQGIKGQLAGLFDTSGMTGSGRGFIGFFSGLIAQVAPIVTGLIDKFGPVVSSLLPMLDGAFNAIIPVVRSVIGQILPVIRTVLPVVMQVSGIMTTLFRTAFMALLPIIPPLAATLGQLVQTLVGGLGPILTSLAPLISTLINTGVGEFKAILQALVPILPPLISAIGQIAQVLAGALLRVLAALLPVLPSLAEAFGQIARAIGGALISAVSAIAPLLPTLINAFMSLVQAALLPLLPLLPAIASLIPPIASVIAALVGALAPFLPLLVRVVVTLVQLAVTALLPLMPVIQIAASLLVVLVRALVPIISLVLSITSSFLRFSGALIGDVIGAVSTVIGWFQRLLSGISGVVASIGRLLGGMFDGLGGAAQAAFGAVTGVIRGFINAYLSIVNGAIGLVNRNIIANINHIPGVNIPSIPTIPKLHSGGEFLSGAAAGEGLALLRDHEVVVTPEQRSDAEFIAGLYAGAPPAAPAAAAGPAGASLSVTNNIVQQPGEDAGLLAARVTNDTVWKLNSGITRRVGSGAATP